MLRIAAIISFILLFLPKSPALVIDCKFEMVNTYLGTFYTCNVQNLRLSLHDRNVTDITGTHMRGRTNDDVKQFYVKKQFCPYLPLNVGSHFKNLNVFYVMNSNLQHLLTGDLEGLTKLKMFDVSHNPIEQLGADFFVGHSTITEISFFDCHLKVVDPHAFDPLTNLDEVHFQYNVCLDYKTDYQNTVEDFIQEVRDKCQNDYHEERIRSRADELTKAMEKITEMSKNSKMSFMRKNAYWIMSILGIICVLLMLTLIKVVRTTYKNNWHELKDALI